MDDLEKNDYLRQLVESSFNDINGALILRKNGQIVNYYLPDDVEPNKISLIGTILMGSSQRACDELNKGNLKHFMVGGDFGKILFVNNADDEFLGVLVPSESKYDDVLEELEMVTALIK